ncbi:MAG: hypothetical protein M1832_000666 [Thelocarpon impressellum]|nr:MAG: hypothetical protein M1832_000666 [Thelocarpon impressellum]
MAPPEEPLGVLSTFPKTTDEFEADARVSFSTLDHKWILEAEDGAEYHFDDGLGRWVAVMDEALLEQQQAAYAVAGVDESEPAQPQRKRKNIYTNGEEEEGGRAKKAKAGKEVPAPRKNTAVYVTNLPPDATVDEVSSVFSKCGVIAEEIDGRAPRIKLYADVETGSFKGDALVVYFRAESVELAVQMLDDTDFRFGYSGKMRVQAADFSYKKQQQEEGPTKTSMKDKKKIIRKTQKLNSKLADWDDDDPSTLQETTSRWDKVVILKHLFTLQELEEDPAAMLDIKEDIRDECEKLGPVTNVVLFDGEPDGVVSVRFASEEAAKACVRSMHNRLFSGQRIQASIATGAEKWRRGHDVTVPITHDAGLSA